MNIIKKILVSTRLDRHNEKLPLEALEKMVSHANRYYIPVGEEHDPRIPPRGRLILAEIKQDIDGEYVVEGTIENFDDVQSVMSNLDLQKSIEVKPYHHDKLELGYDRSYKNDEDLKILQEINNIINSPEQPQFNNKKSLEPISILIIGGGFILSNIFGGFFQKLGADAYDKLKNKLKQLFARKQSNDSDRLLLFEFVVDKNTYKILVEVIITNPTDDDIENFFNTDFHKIDNMLSKYITPNSDIRKFVFEYKNCKYTTKFMVRNDCVPFIEND